jgi:hypothetical protein
MSDHSRPHQPWATRLSTGVPPPHACRLPPIRASVNVGAEALWGGGARAGAAPWSDRRRRAATTGGCRVGPPARTLDRVRRAVSVSRTVASRPAISTARPWRATGTWPWELVASHHRTRAGLGRQGEVHGPLGVQPGGVEHRDRCVLGADQQVELGAAQQDALGPRSTSAAITRRAWRESSRTIPWQCSR